MGKCNAMLLGGLLAAEFKPRTSGSKAISLYLRWLCRVINIDEIQPLAWEREPHCVMVGYVITT